MDRGGWSEGVKPESWSVGCSVRHGLPIVLADQQNRVRAEANYKSLAVYPEIPGSEEAGSCGDRQRSKLAAAAG